MNASDDEFPNRTPIIAAAVLIVAAGGGLWYFLAHRTPSALVPVPATQPQAAIVPAPPAEPVIAHPVPAAAGGAQESLPALNDSDQAILAALGTAAGSENVKDHVVPENVIRRIVATVDNLPRQRVPAAKRPVIPVPGVFHVDGDELHATLDPANYSRYRPFIDALRDLDMQRLVDVYLRFYPLFQGAYQDLGYPNGYFNDRLIDVIDVLLKTPDVPGPVELVRPNVLYVFADPTLEARPAGQKLLIRMGPENAAIVKAKLMELRADLTAAHTKN
jgi:hypothetical protein